MDRTVLRRYKHSQQRNHRAARGAKLAGFSQPYVHLVLKGSRTTPQLARLSLSPTRRGCGLPRPLARVNHQHSKYLHRFEPGVVIGADVDKNTIHHKELARLHRIFDNVQHLIR